MTTIQFNRAWCDNCFDDCYWSYNATSGITRHIGSGTDALASALRPLRDAGYHISHRGHGDYTATLYKAAPLALDWQMALDLRESVDQDW